MKKACVLFAQALALAVSGVAQEAVAEARDSLASHPTAPWAPMKASELQSLQTPKGARWVVPGTWTVLATGGSTVMSMPEGASRIVLIEVEADDAEHALTAGWAAVSPEPSRSTPKLVELPANNGWEYKAQGDYGITAGTTESVDVQVRRIGRLWAVTFSIGQQALFEKRQADVAIINGSLLAPGFTRESLAGRAPNRLDEVLVSQMKHFLTQAAGRLQIPGLAFALLDHGEVVFEGGVGVRRIGGHELVDAHTVFMNASTTKAMTTMLMARLVDAGRLSWNQPVSQVYPGFKLGDSETTRWVEVHHLVCACTGLPRRDIELLFNFRSVTPEKLIERIAGAPPTSEFGEVYQYNNQLAATAGYLAGHAAFPNMNLGSAYDRAMQEYLFRPTGMLDTTFDMVRAQKGNHAWPHGVGVDGRVAVAAMALNYSGVPIRPAGGAWTSIHDLARFVQLEAREGRLGNGDQLISSKNVLARRIAQVTTGLNTFYGMGLGVSRKLGITSVNHSGSLFGYNSTIFLVPETGIGLVAMSNSEQGMGLLNVATRRLLELTYGANPEAEAVLEKMVFEFESGLKERKRIVASADYRLVERLVERLAKKYANEKLGVLTVRQSGRFKVFDFGDWKTRVIGHTDESGELLFVGIDPTADFVEFRAIGKTGRRSIVVEIGQERYQFDEAN